MNEECLVVFLIRGKPEFGRIDCARLPVSFARENRVYRPHPDDGLNGFYDWLRDETQRVIGVVYFPNNRYGFLAESLKNLPYVDVETLSNGQSAITIYFSSLRLFDLRSSDDQEFGSNWLFETAEGEYALSFNGNNARDFVEAIEPVFEASS